RGTAAKGREDRGGEGADKRPPQRRTRRGDGGRAAGARSTQRAVVREGRARGGTGDREAGRNERATRASTPRGGGREAAEDTGGRRDEQKRRRQPRQGEQT
ncbi:RNase adaptor protein RapZ, partial [Mycobacterium tuberculosis]|uniref:RNase adapter RapZ n=1 Tax=Mycobacterium tuberculosis TaxID=1773 RepID=UPI000E37F810